MFPQWTSLTENAGFGNVYSPMAEIPLGDGVSSRVGNSIVVRSIDLTVHLWMTRAKTGGATPATTDYQATFFPNSTGTQDSSSTEMYPEYRVAAYKVPFNLYSATNASDIPPPFCPCVMDQQGPVPSGSTFLNQNPYIIPAYSPFGTPTIAALRNQPYLIDAYLRNPVSEPLLGYIEDVRKWSPFKTTNGGTYSAIAGAGPSFYSGVSTVGGLAHQTEHFHYRPKGKEAIVTYNPNDATFPWYPITNFWGVVLWSNELQATMASLQLNANAYITTVMTFDDYS